jgi:1-hydroxycarotenoid 3,4-desaturase
MSSFQRSNALTQIENLFLAGGSVHPGPGVPMAALSGRQAVAALMARRNSTKR